MMRAVMLTALVILAVCWLTRSAADAIANRVVDAIERRVHERRQRPNHYRRLP